MARKQILTNAEIEKDIISALENPPKESEVSYRRWTIPFVIGAILLVVIEYFYRMFILWFLLALIVVGIGSGIVHYVRHQNRIKHVTISDYDIMIEIVHSTGEEHYRAKTAGTVKHRRTEQISNYIIRFESGKVWRVPKVLYGWSERLRMDDRGIHHCTHRGDTMIVVAEKGAGEIFVAYNTELFEYRNR